MITCPITYQSWPQYGFMEMPIVTIKSLWGELPSADAVRPPVLILKEQAAALSELTNGVLSAKVAVSRQRDNMSIELRIVAPALGGYEYGIVHAYHKMSVYPAYLRSAVEHHDESIECIDSDAFERELADVLQSETVRKALASLIAQSKAAG